MIETRGHGSYRNTLESVLSRASGRPVRVVSVRRRPSEFATVYPAEVVSVTLGGGGVVQLFVKHLGNEQADHPDKQRRDREILVYEELLDTPALPVVRLHGWRWHAAAERYELYLEYIDDWNLKYQELRYWFEAARALGRLHAHFGRRAERLTSHDYLLRLDAAYFHQWAERACVALQPESPALAELLRPVVHSYEAAARLLEMQPPTLVHNDMAPKNVLVYRAIAPARVCFVDWEMAGRGCGLLDLVDLAYGLDPESHRTMRDAYLAEARDGGLLLPTGEELQRVLAACELHKTMGRLACGRDWGVQRSQLAAWVDEARRHWTTVDGRQSA